MVRGGLDGSEVAVAGMSAGGAEPSDGANPAVEAPDMYWAWRGGWEHAKNVLVYCESVMAYD